MRGGDFLGFGETEEQRIAREAAERAATGQQPQNTGILDTVANGVNTGVSTVANGFENLVTSPGEVISDVTSNITNKTKEGLLVADNKLGQLQDELQDKANNTLDTVTDAATEGFNNVSNIITGNSEQDPTKVQEPVPEQSMYQGPDQGGQVKPWYKFWGGKRHMTGGQGLGLTYYATPVNGLKVAEPTYMEYYTGGRRKRSTRKRKCCKRHRHCRKTCNKRHKHCKK
jgi:hypothetical protein